MVLGLWKERKPRILSSFTATECLYGVLLQSASAGERQQDAHRKEWLPSSERKREGEGIMGKKVYDNHLLQNKMT